MKRKEDEKKSAPVSYSCVFPSLVLLLPSCPLPFSHHTAVIIDWGFYTLVAPVFDWHGVWSWRPLANMLWLQLKNVRLKCIVACCIYTENWAYKNKGVFFVVVFFLGWLWFFYIHTPPYRPTFIWNTSVLFIKHIWKIKELYYASSLVKTTLLLWIRNEWITANTQCILEMTHSESWII